MNAFDIHSNDEVFNLKTRQVGTVLNVKELTGPVNGVFVRVMIKQGLPDEIWPVEETVVWFRQKRYIEAEKH